MSFYEFMVQPKAGGGSTAAQLHEKPLKLMRSQQIERLQDHGGTPGTANE